MTSTNFPIRPFTEGLRKDSKPDTIAENAFVELNNSYQFRNRIVKRSGYQTLGRLDNGTPVMGLKTRELAEQQRQLIAFDTTDAYQFTAGTFSILPSVLPTIWSGTDFQFFFTTNYANSFWATNSKSGLHGAAILDIDNSNPALVTTTAPHGFTSGQTVAIINVSGYTPLAPGTPPINGATFVITVTGASTFTIPLDGALYGPYLSGGFALNSSVNVTGQDGIRYYAQTIIGDTWVNYNPPIDPDNALTGALLIFPYRGYLVFLNTMEGNEEGIFNFPNRARWTQIGTPYYSPPVPEFPNPAGIDPFAVRDDLFGRGGANDAPTNELIVGAAFVRDILVVYFSRSTWRLRFVNNSQNPFVWERVNIEFGSDCTFSTIPFDKGVMAIGSRGIVISDSNDTVRFDEKIPNDIFDIRQTNNGFQRVYGIRTFRTRLVYWTFPSSSNSDSIYPNKVLVFNYDTKNWSYFDDTFTCFGYYYLDSPGLIWGDLTEPWNSYNDTTWGSGTTNSGYEEIIAGNQQGYVFQLEKTNGSNSPSLTISNIAGSTVTSTNYNLEDGRWITLSAVTGTTFDDGVSLNGRNFKIAQQTDGMGNILPDDFSILEWEPLSAGDAVGTNFPASGFYQIGYSPVLAGSVQINVGSLVFTDPLLNGVLVENASLGSGLINYTTGALTLIFSPAIVSTPVFIRLVSLDPEQTLIPVGTTGAFGGEGEITVISNFDIQTKIFNFFKEDRRARISKIDFYTDVTQHGQFECNVFADSTDQAVNTPLSDNPESNVVLTSLNPYQFGTGDETIYRLYCEATAQTVQLQLTMNDRQICVNAINSSDMELLGMIFTMRQGGRLI